MVAGPRRTDAMPVPARSGRPGAGRGRRSSGYVKRYAVKPTQPPAAITTEDVNAPTLPRSLDRTLGPQAVE